MSTWNPVDYSKNSSEQQKWARELIEKLALRGDEQVLDIGCGDGKVTAELAAHLPRGRIIGLDASAEMVKFASANFPQASHPNLSFVHGDASRLPFNSQFDVIFSNATLHWVYDHAPILAGIRRSLKPGGRMLAQMGGKGCAADVMSIIDAMRIEPEWATFFENFKFRYGFHGPVEYRAWLEQAGLEPIRVDLFAKDMVHAGAERMAGWFRSAWIPYVQAIPARQQDQFIAELVSRYIAQHPLDANGNVHIRMMRLEVEAVRGG